MPFWNQRVEIQERFKRGSREIQERFKRGGKRESSQISSILIGFCTHKQETRNTKKHKETQEEQDAPIKTTKIARTNEAGIKFPVKPVS